MRVWWGDSATGGKPMLVEKPVPVPIYLPKTAHGTTWNRTWISVVTAWRVTHSAKTGSPQMSSLHPKYTNTQPVPRSKHTPSRL